MVIGDKKTDTYHRPSCPYVKLMKPKNKVRFESEREAIKAGFGRHNVKYCMGK